MASSAASDGGSDPTTAHRRLRIISGEQVKELLTMRDAIEVNAEAFKKHFNKAVDCPDRTVLEVKRESGDVAGHTLFMPAHLQGGSGLGVKIVSVRAGNAAKGLPTVPSAVLVVDEETAFPRAMLDGTYLTALRTAAGSGAATRALVPSSTAPASLVVFGAGMQGRAHIEAMMAIREVSQVTIVNRSLKRAQDLASEFSSLYDASTKFTAVTLDDKEAIRTALSCADLVCTCTDTSTPLFDGSWLKPGAHINAVGSYRPDMQELDDATVKRARVVVDTTAALVAGDLDSPLRAGAITQASHIAGELGEVLSSAVDVRASLSEEQDITIFKSVGVAFQDVATAQAVLLRAEAAAVGTVVTM